MGWWYGQRTDRGRWEGETWTWREAQMDDEPCDLHVCGVAARSEPRHRKSMVRDYRQEPSDKQWNERILRRYLAHPAVVSFQAFRQATETVCAAIFPDCQIIYVTLSLCYKMAWFVPRYTIISGNTDRPHSGCDIFHCRHPLFKTCSIWYWSKSFTPLPLISVVVY